MTTIAMRRLEDNSGVLVAADEQVSAGNTRAGTMDKVFEVGPVLFGVAGRVRDANILRYQLEVPEMTKKDRKNPKKYVVTKLIPAIVAVFEENGRIEAVNGQKDSDSHILFAIDGLCGIIGGDFSLSGTEEPYLAIGSGSDFALGAMARGAEPLEAVEVASYFDVYTGAPSNISYFVEWDKR